MTSALSPPRYGMCRVSRVRVEYRIMIFSEFAVPWSFSGYVISPARYLLSEIGK